MNESLNAACREFEQVILAQMLRSAGIGRSANTIDDDGERTPQANDDAVQQLFVQALSGALERAGGIGLQKALVAALAGRRA